jgi:hypothetical protein
MKSFSDALREECKGSGVQVQTVCPGFVNTGFVANANAVPITPGMLYPTPDTFAKNAVATIGVAPLTSGYWPHEIQVTFYLKMRKCLNIKKNALCEITLCNFCISFLQYQLIQILPMWMRIKIAASFVDKEAMLK